MKLFGYEITFSKKKADIEETSSPFRVHIPHLAQLAIDSPIPQKMAISEVPEVKPNTLSYAMTRGTSRGVFIPPEYDLVEIGRVEDTDSFVRQAFKKKIGLMFKEGVGYAGANRRTLEYIKIRAAQLARASKIPTIELLKRVAHSLIRTSNAYILKVRDIKASGGKTRVTPEGKALKPIAAYFPMAPETMSAELNKSGQITKWRHQLPDGQYKDFSPKDVIHFTVDRREGFLFGVPTLVPVIDDVRALRQIEENIELLLYQHLFPLIQYKVGTETRPAGITEDGQREIDVVKTELRYMPLEGSIVTPERHEIHAVGLEGRAIRAEGYLTHFKKRVFAGLGVSQIDMGDGDTTNRACYSEDTETLTEFGWKYYWQINPKTDRIATLNPSTNKMEFHYSTGGLYLYDYQGEMVRFKGKAVDTLVTPEHEMWANMNPYSSPDKWQKVQAKEIDKRHFRFQVACGGSDICEEVDFFDLPYVPYVHWINKSNSGPIPSIRMDDWLEFLGYFISEGTYGRTKNQWAISISQNERVYPQQTAKIRDCLDRLPFSFCEYKDTDDTVRFWIHCKSLYLYLFNEVGNYSYQKRIPDEYFKLSDRQLQILLDGLILGDGSIDKREGRTNLGFSSSSNLLINQVQSLCVRLGYRSILSTGTRCNRLSLTPTTTSQIGHDSITREQYNGKVYCFHVPNHLFITRRNGKVGIHGNTANTLSRALIDTVKDIQDALEAQWDHEVISELLLESTFGIDVLDEKNMVHLKFSEIDIENRMEQEKHHLEIFQGNGLTYDEFRAELQREPIPIPEDGEDQDPSKYPEWFNTHHKLFEEPLTLIRAVDEPYSPAAQAAAAARSMAQTQSQLKTAQQEEENKEKRQAEEDRKTKVAVAKARPKLTQQKNSLSTEFNNLRIEIKADAAQMLRRHKTLHLDQLRLLAGLWASNMVEKFMAVVDRSLKEGFDTQVGNRYSGIPQALILAEEECSTRVNRFVKRLAENTISLIGRRIDKEMMEVSIENLTENFYLNIIDLAFKSLDYRARFIQETELTKAYNYGMLLGVQYMGYSFVKVQPHQDCCDRCQAVGDHVYNIFDMTLDNIVPLHPGCKCSLQPVADEEETTDGVKLERCVVQVKKSLRKRHPNWSSDRIKSSAWAICQSRTKG